MVTIENKQTNVNINLTKLRKDAHTLLAALDYADYDLGIWLIDNDLIQQYNRQYRDKDEPTDILSFAYHDTLQAGERIVPQSDEDKNLGDLMISLEFVHEIYPGEQFYPRMQKLLVHGICHLLGHDHDTEETDKVMLAIEDSLLEKLQKRAD